MISDLTTPTVLACFVRLFRSETTKDARLTPNSHRIWVTGECPSHFEYLFVLLSAHQSAHECPALHSPVPENTSGSLQATAYFADGREVRSFIIEVFADKAVSAGACVLRSHTIAPLSVYQEPSDTAEIIGAIYSTSMVETVGKNTNGWYKIKTDEVSATGNFDQKNRSGNGLAVRNQHRTLRYM